VLAYTPREVLGSMETKTVLAGVLVGVVILGALAMLPDFIRYMKIRAM